MKIEKIFTGVCPTQNKNFQVVVTYVDNGFEYEKGTFRCEYTKYGGTCNISNSCPIYQRTPE